VGWAEWRPLKTVFIPPPAPPAIEDVVAVTTSEDALLKIFINTNYKYYEKRWRKSSVIVKRSSITKYLFLGVFSLISNINWGAAFYPFFWFAYRKMYIHWLIITILSPLIIISYFSFLGLFVFIFFGCFADSAYKRHCIKKINIITPKHILNEDIKGELKSKGGVNLWLAVILSTFPIIIIYLITHNRIIKNFLTLKGSHM
jgi:hypothetical protein